MRRARSGIGAECGEEESSKRKEEGGNKNQRSPHLKFQVEIAERQQANRRDPQAPRAFDIRPNFGCLGCP